MRDVFLESLLAEMEINNNIFFVTADFGSPVLDKIKKLCPERFINVGIAEQNLINISAGLALEGYVVYAYAIAPFITMRCFEQIRVNLAILSQERPMNVNLIGVGAGCSYVVSGPTHQCLEDISIMRTLPNVEVMSPSDWILSQKMFEYTLENTSVKYLRFDSNILPSIYPDDFQLSNGFAELLKGESVCIVSTGYMTHIVLDVVSEFNSLDVNIGVIDLFMFESLNINKFIQLLDEYRSIITIEEGFINKGGLDSFVLHLLNQFNRLKRITNIGFPECYNFELGDRNTVLEKIGCGHTKLKSTIEEML